MKFRSRLARAAASAVLAVALVGGGAVGAGSVAPADAAAACITDDSISYTYDLATNTSVITVEPVIGSTGVTCDPLYVIAASWRFDDPTQKYPQTRDVVNVYPAITTPGSYTVSALVTCGQGDIYAAHSPLEYPTPTLVGPSDPYIEHHLSGKELSDISGPSKARGPRTDNCATPTPTATPSAAPTPAPTTVPTPGRGVLASVTVTASAGATAQQCIPGDQGGPGSGYLTVVFPAGAESSIRYFTGSTELTAARTAVAPGSYLVTAVPANADTSIFGATTFPLVVGAVDASCVEVGGLASTGTNPAGLLGAAGVLLVGGAAIFLGMRRRRLGREAAVQSEN